MTTPTLTWVTSDGTRTELAAATGFEVYLSAQGFNAITPINTVEQYTSFDGAALANRRYPPRNLVFPMFVSHATRAQTAVGDLARMLRGPGLLEYADDTVTRYLRDVVLETLIEGPDMEVTTGEKFRKVVVSLLALDPWWYGEAELHVLPVGTQTDFDADIAFDAVLPFNGGSSLSVDVTGDTDAFPVVTVYGPADSVLIAGGGLEWETAVALESGDVLVVDTRPGSRGPRLNGGGVNWTLLTESSRLWTFPTGTQAVIVGATGADSETAAQLEVTPRWLTP